MKQNDTKEEDKLYTKFDKQLGDFFLKIYKEIGIAGTVLVIIIFLIGFIWLISQEPIQCLTFDIAASHNVGDAMGGMLSPVIGLIAVVLTFCAFYVQYQFNKKQLDFYMNDKLDKKIDDFSKLLDVIIDRGDCNGIKVGLVATDTCESIESITDESILKETPLFALFQKEFEVKFKESKKFVVSKYTDDEIYSFSSKILNLYIDFYSFIRLFLIEIRHFNLTDDKKYNLYISFINKLSMLSNNPSSSVLLMCFVYSNYIENLDGNENKIINRYFETERDKKKVEFYKKCLIYHQHLFKKVVL